MTSIYNLLSHSPQAKVGSGVEHVRDTVEILNSSDEHRVKLSVSSREVIIPGPSTIHTFKDEDLTRSDKKFVSENKPASGREMISSKRAVQNRAAQVFSV